MKSHKYSTLFQLCFKCIKYFFLVIIGLSIALVLAMLSGALGTAIQFFPVVFAGMWRVGILIICFILITAIVESLK